MGSRDERHWWRVREAGVRCRVVGEAGEVEEVEEDRPVW